MTEAKRFVMAHDEARRRAVAFVSEMPHGWEVVCRPPKRNLAQNSLMWVILEAFSEQLKWPVNGQMVRLEPLEWKDVLTAAFRNETHRVAMGLNGGMVILGMRTSEFRKAEFIEFIEFLQATAAERGVVLDRQEVAA